MLEELKIYINNKFCVLAGKIKTYVDQVIITNNGFATVATKADADALAATLTSQKIIDVTADETQGGIPATYYFNGTILQEILLL